MSYGNRIQRGPMAGDRFTQISNALFRDPRLSLKAKGLFGLISTHRDGFGLSIRSIARSVKESKDAVGTGLKELEKFGYLERIPRYDGGKFAGYVYRITDMPAHLYDLFGAAPRPENPDAEEPDTAPCPGNPDAEDPDAGNPDPEDPHTKKTTTKKIKKKEDQDTAPSARSAGGVRSTSTSGSSACDLSGSAATEQTGSSAKGVPGQRGGDPKLTREQVAAVHAVEAALPAPLVAGLPYGHIPNRNRPAVLAALESRTIEQLAERVARRWVAYGYEPALHDGLIRSFVGAAVELIAPTPHCPDPSCEDGLMIDTGGNCRACVERRAERRVARLRGGAPRRTATAWPECDECGRPFPGAVPDNGLCRSCDGEPGAAIQALLDGWAAEDRTRAEAEALDAETTRRREQRAADEARTAADEQTVGSEAEAEEFAWLREQIAHEAPYLLAYSQTPQQDGSPPF
ncbi:helix-turn-helix domain-containing protein [Streptomyces shenzhenensis]